MNTLSQKKKYEKREFKLMNSKLYHNIIKNGNENEVDIPYENIEGDKLSYKTINNAILIISIVLYVIAIGTFIAKFIIKDVEPFAYVIWFALATLLLIPYWNSKRNYWKIKLSDNNSIYFHKNIPDEQTVNKFLENLIIKRNNYLIKNYGEIDENLDYKSQLENLKWLRNISVITEEHFEIKHKELKQLFTPDKNNIGFK